MHNILNRTKLESQLRENHYSDAAINKLVEKFESSEDDIIFALNLFLKNGSITDLQSNGYSVSYLQDKKGMNFFNALGTIDWLRRSPETAKNALEKMHDSIRYEDGVYNG